ncbi:DUF3237 domain-containing protein [Spirillospora sp. NPDC047279]|uniref:DUF3237 domain-containing protein n=1 Tax=Spirillospora sp. NPDC047279 TaxID=3155478 RepID=UPI0033D40537
MDSRVKDVADVRTAFLFDMVVDLEKPVSMGAGPFGRRILFGSAGGTFEGPRLRGDVLKGGGDWSLFRPDGTMLLDVRLTLRTDDGAAVYMTYGGRWVAPPPDAERVDPSEYYFRTNPLFETGDERYAWLNDVVCVGSGYLVEGGVAYRVSEVL